MSKKPRDPREEEEEFIEQKPKLETTRKEEREDRKGRRKSSDDGQLYLVHHPQSEDGIPYAPRMSDHCSRSVSHFHPVQVILCCVVTGHQE